MSTTDYMKGYMTGRRQLITAIKELLEESENRISIISILELLDRADGEIEKIEANQRKE